MWLFLVVSETYTNMNIPFKIIVLYTNIDLKLRNK